MSYDAGLRRTTMVTMRGKCYEARQELRCKARVTMQGKSQEARQEL